MAIWLIVQCVVCGKQTANGRLPRLGRHKGDGSERFPRRHRGRDGEICPGVFEFGSWLEPPTGDS
ncbi:hypothetical protein MARCHEWKA_02510 [Brevundimonas phage vB_BpoS-Marchewka]|uniref:Uncharacterized protein n=1 Tax=Brevundimonas phage vB_BpoS-Marchewka TaxID=2948604 RepID=A0A9E7N2W1_9CAUD|nr:hypothetical protein MARCHEWKA_02510 [Brevundimonas phage vB_BpoS-Marchewka]UTC29210.1 hypothetical protein BAMBUS_01280 [Brevundimonas phage vB_BpoS-Bambus]